MSVVEDVNVIEAVIVAYYMWPNQIRKQNVYIGLL